jgi:hypothetical protein
MRRPVRMARLLALALPLSGCAGGPGHGHSPNAQYYAEPADVIATELAFARAARAKGQWTAWREAAARDAQMFAPANGATAAVRVDAYAKGRANPPVSVSWDPQAVWMSCDSTIAVSYGAWQKAPDTGWYVTVWQHQKKGGYKFVLDLGDSLPKALPAPEMIRASLADCPAGRARSRPVALADHHPDAPAAPEAGPPNYLANEAKDHTLAWSASVTPAGAASFTLRLKQDGQMREVLRLPATGPN